MKLPVLDAVKLALFFSMSFLGLLALGGAIGIIAAAATHTFRFATR